MGNTITDRQRQTTRKGATQSYRGSTASQLPKLSVIRKGGYYEKVNRIIAISVNPVRECGGLRIENSGYSNQYERRTCAECYS